LLENGTPPLAELLRELIVVPATPLPELAMMPPELCVYDELLSYLTSAPKEMHK